MLGALIKETRDFIEVIWINPPPGGKTADGLTGRIRPWQDFYFVTLTGGSRNARF